MEDQPIQELTYEENSESFGVYFRKNVGEKWRNYLKGNERGISIEERDSMRAFLLEYGTDQEIQTKLNSFLDTSIPSYEALKEELKSKRPNFT